MDTNVAPELAPRMTVAEFLEWEPADGGCYQLIDGVPHLMAPTKRTHGALHAEVARLLGNHLRAIGSPCSVIISGGVVPAAMAAINMRVPDLALTCTPYVDEEAALSNPVLLVEILSRSNTTDTWANVWAYTTLPSAREILILHTQAVRAEILRRRPDGAWPEDLVPVETGDLELTSVGFRAKLIDLYATTRFAETGGDI